MTDKKVESVYSMLGYSDPESMQLKARLADKISEIIKARGLTGVRAAEMVGMPQPKLSNLLRGQFRGVSEAKMMECITRLGSDVEILVRAAPATRAAHVTVPQGRRAARPRTAQPKSAAS